MTSKAIKLKIGRNVYTNQPVYYTLRYFGVTLCVAISRFGKSAITKNLAVKVSGTGRKLVVLDFHGEWADHITSYNWKSRMPARANNYYVLKHFGFKVSDFNLLEDWIALGITEKGSALIAELASTRELHKDEPKLFLEILEHLPTSEDEIELFNKRYCEGVCAFRLNSKIHEQIQATIASHFRRIRVWFLSPTLENRLHLSKKILFDLLTRYDTLIIEFDMHNLNEEIKAMAEAGKVLEYMKPLLPIFQPFIVVEEADKLAPNNPRSSYQPSSLNQLADYACKEAKNAVAMLLISQSTLQISPEITKHAHTKILGKLPFDDPFQFFTQDLYWDFDRNIREMVWIDLDGSPNKFMPDLTVCKAGG